MIPKIVQRIFDIAQRKPVKLRKRIERTNNMYTATKSQLRESPRSIDIDVLTVKLIPKSSVALRSHSKNIHGRDLGNVCRRQPV